MVVDCNIVATDDAWQFILCESFAVDVNWWIIGLENPFPHRRQLIIAIDKNGFHEGRSGRYSHLIRSAVPKSNGMKAGASVDGSPGADYMQQR